MGFVSGTEAIYSFPSHSHPLPSPPHPHRRASLDLPGLIHRRAAWQVPGVAVRGPAGYNWRRGWRNQSPFRFPRSMQTTGGAPGDGGVVRERLPDHSEWLDLFTDIIQHAMFEEFTRYTATTAAAMWSSSYGRSRRRNLPIRNRRPGGSNFRTANPSRLNIMRPRVDALANIPSGVLPPGVRPPCCQ